MIRTSILFSLYERRCKPQAGQVHGRRLVEIQLPGCLHDISGIPSFQARTLAAESVWFFLPSSTEHLIFLLTKSWTWSCHLLGLFLILITGSRPFFWILAMVAQNISSAQAVLSTYVGRSKRQSKKFQSCSEKISLHDVVYASPC
jgi:hypothetical protein